MTSQPNPLFTAITPTPFAIYATTEDTLFRLDTEPLPGNLTKRELAILKSLVAVAGEALARAAHHQRTTQPPATQAGSTEGDTTS